MEEIATTESSWPTRLSIALRLDQVVESPTNPRRTHDNAKDDELAESIATLGVLQPVLVRPLEQGFELVFGHRRLRAARKAGLDTIPAFVRELSDLEVLEAQLVENTQRADVEPLEEARAYKRLHSDYGRSVDEIAAKVGKSRAHVYGRLKLLELCAPGQKAIETGALEATVGLLVARIPSEKLQREALNRLRGYNGDPVSYRHAAEVIQREFMLRLREAPFDRADAKLVATAGPCTTCPKRTGNQAELFADVKSADLCTDPACYEKKVDAGWKQRAAAARASGQEVLEGKAAEKARHSGDFVALGDRCWDDGKQRTYAQLLGKDAPPAILVRGDREGARELVRQADVRKILREKGVLAKRDESYRTGRSPAMDLKRELVRKTVTAAIAQVLERSAALVAGDGWWRFLAIAAAKAAWHDTLKGVVSRRGWTANKKNHERLDEVIARCLKDAGVPTCREVAIEILVSRGAISYDGYGEALIAATDAVGVDLKKLEASTKAELDAARKARKQKAKARAKKKVVATAGKLAKASRGGEEELARVVGELHGCRPKKKVASNKVRACRKCGCTDADCSQCIEKTGEPCTWVEKNLCSACAEDAAWS